MMRNFAFIPLMCLAASSSLAQEFPGRVESLITPDVIEEIKGWSSQPIVKLAVEAQNQRHGVLTQDEIDELDKTWREEAQADDKPLISATIASPLSNYLLKRQAASVGLYKEIFIMDVNGLNVGQSSITTDYWQGDEAKFQKTFAIGPTEIFIDKPEFDDGLKIWTSQVSMTLADKDSGDAFGAITVEINLTELSRRRTPAF
ncbi:MULTISPECIES: hypothetical protein [Filomicrobium]|nr:MULTISPECIES: hypothetical protein [Filomicrobium]